MDFYIQLAAKNEVMSYVNAILPAVTGMGGVLIGLFVNGRRERRARQRETENVRSMIYRELSFVKTNIENLKKHITEPVMLAIGLANVTAQKPIYDAYIGQISRLEEDEVDKIYTAYWQLNLMNTECQTVKEQIERKELLTNVDVLALELSIEAWASKISEALEQIERYRRRRKEDTPGR